MIDQTRLQNQIKVLEAQRREAVLIIAKCDGAIAQCNHFLAILVNEEAAKKAPEEEKLANLPETAKEDARGS